MKRTQCLSILLVILLTGVGSALAQPEIKTEGEMVTVTFDEDTLGGVSLTLTKAFGVRVCCEDYGVVPAEAKGVATGDFESGGPIEQESEYRFVGEFTARTVEDMLDAVTEGSPYTWSASNTCCIMYPRSGSILAQETVSLEVAPCSLWEALIAIIHARSEDAKASHPMNALDFYQGLPRLGPADVSVSPLTFSDTPVADALCRMVEAVEGDDPGFLAVWTLCSGWADVCRLAKAHLVETRQGALAMSLSEALNR